MIKITISVKKYLTMTCLDLKLKGHYHGWAADVSFNNLLDEKAFDYAVRSTTTAGKYNAQPLPERNITVSISYNFN